MLRPPMPLGSRAFPSLSPRRFSTTSPTFSALFNLNGLAHSRESQYLSKERGIPRTEYHSNIHLIRSSEVDPFPDAPGASKHANQFKNVARKRVGCEATIADVVHTDEVLVRHLNDSKHSSHQKKSIRELEAELRAARSEIARLRAVTHENGLGKDDSHHSSRYPGRGMYFLLVLGGVAFCLWELPYFEKHLGMGQAGTKAPEEIAMVSKQTNPGEEATEVVSAPELTADDELHNSRRSQNGRSYLGFLWASA